MMKSKKSPVIKIVIWICVILMVWSTIWIYIAYMFAPQTEISQNWDEWTNTAVENSTTNENEIEVILPEIDPENPEDTPAPILITEDWEINEMDQTREIQLENGETELVRLWDLSDVIQIN